MRSKSSSLELVHLFQTLGPAYMRWTGRHIPTEGLTPARMRVLKLLEARGPSPMRALKEELGTTATNITGLVDGLAAEGLIERQASPDDRRVTIIALTAKGRRETTGAWEQHERAVARVFERLSPATREQLAAGVRELIAVLAELRHEPDERP